MEYEYRLLLNNGYNTSVRSTYTIQELVSNATKQANDNGWSAFTLMNGKLLTVLAVNIVGFEQI